MNSPVQDAARTVDGPTVFSHDPFVTMTGAEAGRSHRRRKGKTLCCLLAVLGGSLGLHRFYLYGCRDAAGWLYLATTLLYLGVLLGSLSTDVLALAVATLFPLPAFVAAIEGLSLGVVEDAEWDRRHNPRVFATSRSGWVLAVLLVLTVAVTFTSFVASLARATDLLYTGGSFG